MALVVTHNSTADGDPLIDGDDWNANHTITGGGTIRVPVLIGTYNIDNGSSDYTISNLDGDSAGEYYIKYSINHVAGSADRQFFINPNASTSNQKSVRINAGQGSTSAGVGTSARLMIGLNGWSADGDIAGEVYFKSKSGVVRRYTGNAVWSKSDISYYSVQMLGGVWSNTADNITSLEFEWSGGTFGGTIKLYKMVDLTI